MNYSQPIFKDHVEAIGKLKIGIVSAGLSHLGEKEAAHSKLVRSIVQGAREEMERIGLKKSQIISVECPGVLEIPLMTRQIIDKFGLDGVQACALIIDGGIYRHEFVAQSSLDNLMQVALDTGVPVASSALTPTRQNAPETQFDELHENLHGKGVEGAGALIWQILQLQAASRKN